MAGVLVGMSGGVDSSMAACLLKDRGFRVAGVSFVLCEARRRPDLPPGLCCTPESVDEARRTAAHLGIPHSVLDLRVPFFERVVAPFIEGYRRGTTPNPCILCNRHVKFPFLQKCADESGIDFVSTGHYARVLDGRLLKGLDPKKDQSYVLYGLSPDVLKRLVLPLGTMTKTDVRAHAESIGLPAARRPESQEICFAGDRHYWTLIGGMPGKGDGPIIDVETGKVIGRHQGVHLYTLGQRRRLPATGRPRYVVRIDASEKTVYVGPKEMACLRDFRVGDLCWASAEPPLRATVKVRSTMRDEPAQLTVTGEDVVRVRFDKPQWAPAPGQSAVFYHDQVMLGGGVIASAGTPPSDP